MDEKSQGKLTAKAMAKTKSKLKGKLMRYDVNGRTVWLDPHGSKRRTTILIWGAYMYKDPLGDEYLGYWPSFNMPRWVIDALRKWRAYVLEVHTH